MPPIEQAILDGWSEALLNKVLEAEDMPTTVPDLLREHPLAAALLRDKLDRTTRTAPHWDQLNDLQKKCVQTLLVIGTDSCLDYLVHNINLLLSDELEDMVRVAGPHVAGLVAAIQRLWDTIAWEQRITIMLLLKDTKSPTTELIDLVVPVDPMTLIAGDRLRYVTLLGESEDPRRWQCVLHVFRAELVLAACDNRHHAVLRECAKYLMPPHLTVQDLGRAHELGIDI